MIKIRKAGPADNEDILLWRNDLATREASFSLEMISPEAHRAWFEKALKSTDRSLYLAENESGEKIGVVRIDELNPAAAEININLAPAMRGKGYGAKIIQLACSDSKYKLVIARTKEKNIASVRVFLRAGFTHLFDYVDKRWGGGSGVRENRVRERFFTWN